MKPGPCLDAETLAAWADDRLTAAERDAAEAHAADCERCQATIAAMVRAEPPLEPAVAWWRPRSTLRWLVPAGSLTAVAAAAIWFVAVAGMNRPAQVVSTQTASDANEAPSPASPLPAPETTIAKNDVEARPDAAAPSSRAKAMEPAAPERNAPLDKLEAAPGAAAPAPAAVAGSLQESVTLDRKAVGGAAGGGVLRDQASANAMRAEALPEIVSSNPASRWRITRTPGVVQHSADGGSTWEMQQTNAAVELTTGASPQPSVCWMVGRGGAVLLTTDNRTWKRVAFPEAVDLVAVSATDGLTATITTRDGSRFSTSDGGATWDREPVQEIPAASF